MAAVDWHSDALDDLVNHDLWRQANGWEPIPPGIMARVSAVFANGQVAAPHRCRVRGELLPLFAFASRYAASSS